MLVKVKERQKVGGTNWLNNTLYTWTSMYLVYFEVVSEIHATILSYCQKIPRNKNSVALAFFNPFMTVAVII